MNENEDIIVPWCGWEKVASSMRERTARGTWKSSDQDHEKRRSQEDQESEWEPRGHLAKMVEFYREAESVSWLEMFRIGGG